MIMGNSLGSLFFHTEDEALWNTLKKLPTERCVELTIKALREYFQNHPEMLPVLSDDAKAVDMDHELYSKEAVIDKADAPGQSEFSLESLFKMNPSEAKPNPKSDPVNNLLTVIGEEEDEDVLRFFQPDKNKGK
ncbi:hypothetical protein [Desulfitobacterium sp.]|uniref:hypothetical protein n=1 Tax=Desulfitobacterium sp. TaxID=49981 RepID=UPI002B210AE4|nr:hypothetical protein [Desulfitobacterium sp.]MEA4901096.1 hypothetical protein [Desulfitobacterium sp.]